MAEPTEADVAAYASQARKLLVRGLVWAYREGTTYAKFVSGLVTEFARVELRMRELELEMDPRTATELLVDWERNLGIPGNCGALASTTVVRRLQAAAKLAAQGGQSIAYYVDLALSIGWAIEIEEHCPPGLGAPCHFGAGRGVTGNNWPFTWIVHAPPAAFGVFQSGRSGAGDPLTTENLQQLLECTIRGVAPAHTIVLFEYDLPPVHTWGPWEEISPGTIELVLEAHSPVVTNPY